MRVNENNGFLENSIPRIFHLPRQQGRNEELLINYSHISAIISEITN